jgi:hypothetical protein
MDWQKLFSRLTNEHHQPLIPQFLGLDSMRQTLPVQDFFLEQMHSPQPGQGHIPVGQGFNGMNQDLNDQWKDMLQRRMWEQYNQRPGAGMQGPSVGRVDGRMPTNYQGSYMPQLPIFGRRG